MKHVQLLRLWSNVCRDEFGYGAFLLSHRLARVSVNKIKNVLLKHEKSFLRVDDLWKTYSVLARENERTHNIIVKSKTIAQIVQTATFPSGAHIFALSQARARSRWMFIMYMIRGHGSSTIMWCTQKAISLRQYSLQGRQNWRGKGKAANEEAVKSLLLGTKPKQNWKIHYMARTLQASMYWRIYCDFCRKSSQDNSYPIFAMEYVTAFRIIHSRFR